MDDIHWKEFNLKMGDALYFAMLYGNTNRQVAAEGLWGSGDFTFRQSEKSRLENGPLSKMKWIKN